MTSTASVTTAQEVALETAEAKAGYEIGRRIAANLQGQGLGMLDLDALTLGLREAMAGAEPRITEAEFTAAMQEIQAAQAAEASARAEVALTEGRAFLEENKSAEGVTTTDSGLQYKVTTAGTGDSPTPDQQVTVHYTGRLLDGTVFDSSVARGQPATFPVGGVIPGWQEALQLMAPGAVWEVWIPSEIAYGPRGAGADIGPNEVLNFTIELIEING